MSSCYLTPAELDFFNTNGYLVKPGFLSYTECSGLGTEVLRLIDEELDLSTHPGTSFSTGQGQTSDAYFLGSGDKIAFFFEAGALDGNGKLLVSDPKSGINKIGHALHVLSPPFRAVTARPELKSIARSLSFLDPVVVQSMAILKPPRIGGEVVPHQDSTFLYTDPPSAVGVWIPTEKCTEENGCLWFWAGSHKTHPIASRFIRDPERVGTKFISTGEVAGPEPTDKDWIPLPCNAGDLVLIHGSAVHKSEHNHSDKTRYAYTFHLLEGNNKYPADNWLQNSGREPFTRLFEM